MVTKLKNPNCDTTKKKNLILMKQKLNCDKTKNKNKK